MDSLQNLPAEYTKTFTRHLRLFQMIGLDFFEDPKAGFMVRNGKFIFFNVMFVVLTSLEVMYIVTSEENGVGFVDVANAIPCATVFIQDMITLQVIAYRKQQIREILCEVGEMWPMEIVLAEKKAELMKTWMRRLKIFDNSYFILTVIGVTSFQFLPLFLTLFYIAIDPSTASYMYPYNIYYPFTIDSFYRYLFAYLFQSVTSCYLHVCTHLSCILLLVALVYNISTLLRLLQLDLEFLWEPRSEQDLTSCTEVDFNAIKKIVQSHQQLLRLTTKINEIFGLIFLIPVCLSSIILCFFGFLTVAVDVMNITAVFGMMLEIFNLTWPGQLLSDTSSGMAISAYHSMWYERDVKLRKIILCIIARSQRPANLSALGFSKMTLAMFARILSSAWSYLSILNQMYKLTE